MTEKKKETIILETIEDTEKIANEVAKTLKKNSVVLISGELGAGKTTFVKLLGKKLGINEQINSPTFQVLKQYSLKNKVWFNHYDFFRLEKEKKLKKTLPGIKELSFESINVIEWPERDPTKNFWKKLFKPIIYIKIKILKDEKRRLTIKTET